MAETQRKKGLERVLLRIKAFRDHSLAHPKPRPPTLRERLMLCSSFERLPSVLCPREWSHTLELIEMFRGLYDEARTNIDREFDNIDTVGSQLKLRKWLGCPQLERPEDCNHKYKVPKKVVNWRLRVGQICASIDPGGIVFFGKPY
ncbi:MAG: hypothetical protein IH975_04625 [Nitrospinae bacterium]|nr:hypothetical protein [Nitrospinota bacterium]